MMLMSVCGSEICDWFYKCFSDYFSITVIQVQGSVFLYLYTCMLHRKHVYMWVYLIKVAYIL